MGPTLRTNEIPPLGPGMESSKYFRTPRNFLSVEGLPAHHARLVDDFVYLTVLRRAFLGGGDLALNVILRSVIHNQLRREMSVHTWNLWTWRDYRYITHGSTFFVHRTFLRRAFWGDLVLYAILRSAIHDRLRIKIVQMFRALTKLPSAEGMQGQWHHSRQLDILTYLTFPRRAFWGCLVFNAILESQIDDRLRIKPPEEPGCVRDIGGTSVFTILAPRRFGAYRSDFFLIKVAGPRLRLGLLFLEILTLRLSEASASCCREHGRSLALGPKNVDCQPLSAAWDMIAITFPKARHLVHPRAAPDNQD